MRISIAIILCVAGWNHKIIAQGITVHQLLLQAQHKDSLKDFQGALYDLNRALSFELNDTALLLRAKVHMENDENREALDDVNRLIHARHQQAEAYYLRGMIKANVHNYEGAVHDFSKSLAIKRDFIKAYYNRGLAHAYLEEYKQAISDFSKAIELDPNYAHAWFNRGYWKEESGDREGAILDLLRAKELDPKNSEIYVEMAIVYYELGQNDKACEMKAEAFSMGYAKTDELPIKNCK